MKQTKSSQPTVAGCDAEKSSEQVGLVPQKVSPNPKEIGGRRQGLEPTRYGDWEKNGRCIDF